ncbi:sulfatase-like hydrolase/transferase [Candidatus Latescibacterota bacterium]
MPAATTAPRRPNLVLILSDQHNPHVMGCAGDPEVQTPHLDRLAAEGVQLSNCYTPAPLCAPARVGFLTGQYASTLDIWDNGGQLPSSVPTFAHALGAGGYEAVLCGRMHFNGPDQFHGFEQRLHGDVAGYLSMEINGTGNFRTTGQTHYAVQVAGHGRAGYAAFDGDVTDKACDFIAGRDPQTRPFCLVVGYVLPHNPLICSPPWFDHYFQRLPVPDPVPEDYVEGLHPALQAWRRRRGVDQITPQQHHRARAAYYGLVSELDENVGRVLDAVESSGQADDTLVIYASDHGDMATEQHGMWWKSCYFEGSARVPCILRYPRQFAAGTDLPAVTSLIDLGPTLLELTRSPSLPDAEGRSLAPMLSGAAAPSDWGGEVFCEYGGAHGDLPSCMVRSGRWKLAYYHEFDSCLLYDVESDPEEACNRAEDPECAQIAASLLERILGRWSARRALDGMARQNRSRYLIAASGHGAMPHPVPPSTPDPAVNDFDFSQIPDWERLRERARSA